jgi:hypothetical protein
MESEPKKCPYCGDTVPDLAEHLKHVFRLKDPKKSLVLRFRDSEGVWRDIIEPAKGE